MIVDEGDCLGGPPAEEPRGVAIAVLEAPVLAVLDSLLQDALGGEVKQGGTPSIVQPVAEDLPGVVLIVLQATIAPPALQSHTRHQ